uniref:C-type lectin domain-containing protein n=1 Tax=Echeneis naucrates TaxID=173247 RepID=A0A665UGG9_ECHNA
HTKTVNDFSVFTVRHTEVLASKRCSKSKDIFLQVTADTEAQDYCRTYFKDLAMIEDAEENTNVMSLLSNVRVWIGLYRNPWRWSDRSNSSFRNWVVLEPDNFGGQHCVAENSVRYWVKLPPINRQLILWTYYLNFCLSISVT